MFWTSSAYVRKHKLPGDFSAVWWRETAFEQCALLCEYSLIFGGEILGRIFRMGDDDVLHAFCPRGLDHSENLVSPQVACRQYEIMFRDRMQDFSYFRQH